MNDAANDNMCIKRKYYSNRSCADVVINPSRPNPKRREKINLNFYFHTSLPPFEAPQRSVKIKI